MNKKRSSAKNCIHIGEGDVFPAWQALRKITSRSSIHFGKNNPTPSKKKVKPSLKTIYFTGKNLSPSTGNTVENPTTVFRSQVVPPQSKRKGNFVNVLPELSTKDIAEEEKEHHDDPFITGYEEEMDILESVEDREEFSVCSDELEEVCEEEEEETIETSQRCIKVEEPITEKASKKIIQLDQKHDEEVDMCPWKKLTIVLLIFSLAVVTLLIISQAPLYVYLFESLTENVSAFIVGNREDPKLPKEFPTFLDRCLSVISSRKEIVELFEKIDIIGVFAIGFIIFVLIP